MAERGRLHMRDLDAFAEWAAGKGYIRQPAKGLYEVLRLRRPGCQPLIFYRRGGRTEHVSYVERAGFLVDGFLRAKREARSTPKPENRS